MPESVRWAVRVMYASLGLSVFTTIMYAPEMGRMSGELLDCCLFWVVIYWCSKGRNWARILYSLLVVGGVLLRVGATFHGFELPVRSAGFVVIQSVAGIAAVALLFEKSASQWFEGEKVGHSSEEGGRT